VPRASSSIWFDGNQIKTLGLFGLGLFIQWKKSQFSPMEMALSWKLASYLKKTRQCVPLQHSQQTRSHFGHGRNGLTWAACLMCWM
jgi:hypothetical protein